MAAETRPFAQVDVFTAQAYRGNPVAVVLNGAGLDAPQMQAFARWTNLSETTFVLPPTQTQADYRLRIFTPGGELPFAGHPTLGSCHAWLQAGGQSQQSDTIWQECAKGLVPIRRDGDRLAFAAPPLQRSTPSPQQIADVAAALGLAPARILAAQLLDNGPVWFGLLLDSPDTVLSLTPDHQALRRLQLKVGVAAVSPAPATPQLIRRASREARAFAEHAQDLSQPAEPDLEVRAFAAATGVPEDPVTGSLNASLAQWLIAEGRLPTRYIAAQGQCLQRAGRVHLHCDAQGQVWVGGQTVSCISGKVVL